MPTRVWMAGEELGQNVRCRLCPGRPEFPAGLQAWQHAYWVHRNLLGDISYELSQYGEPPRLELADNIAEPRAPLVDRGNGPGED